MTPRRPRQAWFRFGSAGSLALLAVLIAPLPVAAQAGDGRIEVGAGLRWLGGLDFDPVAATETALANGRFTLFDSHTELDAAAGFEARIGIRVTSILQLEGMVSYAKPTLRTRITADSEGIPDTTITGAVAQYTVEGGVTAQLARWRVGRLVPFAAAGAGYLRQLHDGRHLVETGQTLYLGGGLRYPLAWRGGLVRSSGIRADIRAEFLRDGVALDDRTRAAPSLAASFFVTF